ADAIQRNYGGACVQMRLSFSSLAPLFLYFIQWLDCGCCYALPSYLGLFHILICKVYADGDSSVSTYERRASLREFYAIIYPILQQLESSLIERDLKGKGRCKDIVSRRRMEDWKKVSGRDVEREDECGICMEACTKMVLPNCSHAMCIKCYRDWYKRSDIMSLFMLYKRKVFYGDAQYHAKLEEFFYVSLWLIHIMVQALFFTIGTSTFFFVNIPLY
ncbi:hypothetical protein ACJX0J_030549, partial [Zea mays]